LAVEMAVDDLGERIGELDVRIDAIELAGFDQRGGDVIGHCGQAL
jgi:hypothetical protein